MKICMVGEGAFANKHLDALERIEDVEVVSICGGVADRPHQSLPLRPQYFCPIEREPLKRLPDCR